MEQLGKKTKILIRWALYKKIKHRVYLIRRGENKMNTSPSLLTAT